MSHEPTPVVAYYEGASMDYRYWSRSYNMHFGYYRFGMNPLARERMLEEMSRQVLVRVGLERTDASEPYRVADLGCGLGAPARKAARLYPGWQISALSLAPRQIEMAEALTSKDLTNLRFEVRDFTSTGYPNAHFDGAYAIESSCHATGPHKRDFVREAARIVKPGARLVIADGFLKNEPLPRLLGAILTTVCHNWAVGRFANLQSFVRTLQAEGFRVEHLEDISWRVAPSALHVPWVTMKFLLHALFRRVSRITWGHVLASVLSPLVGMARHHFSYCLIVAVRSNTAFQPSTEGLPLGEQRPEPQ